MGVLRFFSIFACGVVLSSTSMQVALAGPNARSAPRVPTITLDMRDLDIYDAVRLLSTQSSANLVLDAAVPHHGVTLQLHSVSFEEALRTFARVNDLAVVRIGKIIYLGTPDTINRRYGTPSTAGIVTRAFEAKNTPADVMAKQLADTLAPGTLVVGDRRTGSVIVTGDAAAIVQASELVAVLDRSVAIQSRALSLRYLKASEALRAIQAAVAFTPPSNVYAVDQQNTLLVSGSAEFLTRVAEVLERIDRPGQQVCYEVRVTDISPSDTSNIGLLFGGLTLGGQPAIGQASTAFVGNSIALNATINALVSKGEASILAQPSLSTLNNVQASLLVGQQFPLVYFDARTGTQQVQFANVGVNLVVLPSIGADGAITTELETDYSTIVNFVSGFPVIGTRRAQSTLRVQDGETIVIAGLFQDLDAKTMSKVPFLADLPLFGELFKNRVKSHVRDEVVFLITPHIVRDRAARTGS